MSKTDSSTPGNTASSVVHYARVTPVAQLAQAAPIAPPQNLEAEESVLGAMIVSESTIDPVVLEIHLRVDDFYRDRWREHHPQTDRHLVRRVSQSSLGGLQIAVDCLSRGRNAARLGDA